MANPAMPAEPAAPALAAGRAPAASLTSRLTVLAVAAAASAVGAYLGAWWVPFLAGVAVGIGQAVTRQRLGRGSVLPAVVGAVIGWLIPVWVLALRGQPVGATALGYRGAGRPASVCRSHGRGPGAARRAAGLGRRLARPRGRQNH